MPNHYIKEKTEALYKTVTPTNMFNVIVASIVVISFWNSQAQIPALIWMSLLSIAWVYRQSLVYLFNRKRESRSDAFWYTMLESATFGAGLGWGLMALIVFPGDVEGGNLMILMIFVGMSATSAVTYSMNIRTYLFFVIPALGLLSVRLYLHPDTAFVNAWWLALLYLGFVVVVNRHIHKGYIRTLDLQAEKDDLISELQQSKKETEESFEAMEAVAEEARTIAVRAQAADRTKGEFLANMSHEIRTPLNHVIGLTNLVLENDLDEESRDYLETVLKSAQSLLEMVNNIIEFSRLEELQETDSLQQCSIQSLIHDVLVSKQSYIDEKPLTVEVSVDDDISELVRADVHKLKLVLSSIVDNAVKFTDQGSISIQVSIQERRDDEMLLLFSVHDTGIGINPVHFDRIFDSFYQVDGTVTRKHGGTGVGLSLAKGLAGFLGGKIWVESTEGVGSSFYFTARVWQSEYDEDTEEN